MFRMLPAVALLALASLTCAVGNDDFGFDVSEDLEVEISEPPPPPMKLKGVPDVTATVGKLLEFTVPGDAFQGHVSRLEIKSPLPSWLSFTPKTSTFSGVPLSIDKADFLVSVAAHGSTDQQSTAFDVFRVHVQRHAPKPRYGSKLRCPKTQVLLSVHLDQQLDLTEPGQRTNAIRNLAGFLGLNSSAFTLGAQKLFSDTTDSSVILAGPGNVNKQTSKQSTSIELQVGCDAKLWKQYVSLVQQLKEQALDGTVSEVLGLPVLGWRVRKQTGALDRGRRDATAPLSDGEDYYDYDDGYDDDDYGGELTTTVVPTGVPAEASTVVASGATPDAREASESHPHRHHHGEAPKVREEVVLPELLYTDEDDDGDGDDDHVTVLPSGAATAVPTAEHRSTTPTKDTEVTTTTASPDSSYYTNYDDEDDYDDDYSETEVPTLATEPTVSRTTWSKTTVPIEETTVERQWTTTTERPTPPVVTIEDFETTTEDTSTITTTTETPTTVMEPTTVATTLTTATTATTPAPTTTSTTTTTTTTEAPITTTVLTTVVTTERPTTTASTTTTTMRTTETIEYGTKNFPPQIHHRLKKIHITAGTLLSYFIPEDTFQDFEDGTNLELKFIDPYPKRNDWIQFNERTREIYGLPLEEHVSKYDFVIEATDKDGAKVTDGLEVTVQQHKGSRTVTHEFKLHLRVEKKSEFPSDVDWQLRTLRGLASLFHNRDLTQIVVRNIVVNDLDLKTIAWTNDTLPKSYCPKTELDYLLSVMTANDEGDPSYALSQVLAPELRVKHVEYRGIGQCEEKPELPIAPPKASPTNFSPIPRNQVDHINATAGELLIFKVPDDTFYDPEDGNARHLKMSLLTMDRQPLPKDHWLQFDVKNQEFYGVPLESDVGRSEYQLVCEDSGGLTANDGLVVAVNPPPKIPYNVEFSMTLDTPYEMFVNSANIKKKFVEKLKDLFRDKDTNSIHINNIREGSTVISWNNKSLATDRCPNSEIKRLRRVLVNDDETLTDRVEIIMSPEFPVASITLIATGVCQGESTVVHPSDIITPIDESTPAESSDEYLITFVVPAVIIAFMLILAGIVACVLYRRRRTGKMNVEEDERQSFRNKGIPVIFQDEIDEKPESGTKAPVILKEEKPPLAPPEYSKGGTPVQHDENEDAPYQPPPPFTTNQDNGRQPRPKPTYRKPPPYVPP